MLEVAVVDGSRVFAEAVAVALAAEPDVTVRCAVTSTGELRRCEALSPVDVVVCDARLFEPARLQQRAGAGTGPGPGWPRPGAWRADRAVVLLADRSESGLLGAALAGGARGWVPREASSADLVAAVREAHAGGTWVPPRLLTAALVELTRGRGREDAVRDRLARLTQRERDVLDCLAEGLSRAETGTRLHLSTNTVRTHVQSILAKLGVNSSVAAVTLATGAEG